MSTNEGMTDSRQYFLSKIAKLIEEYQQFENANAKELCDCFLQLTVATFMINFGGVNSPEEFLLDGIKFYCEEYKKGGFINES